MKHKESNLQQMCIKWFRYMYPEYRLNFFSVPNGGLRGKREAGIMVGEGLMKGVSDTILLVPSQGFHSLCIEFKQETVTYGKDEKVHIHRTRQSDDQKAWQRAVELTGNKYIIVSSYEQFIEEIEKYLGKRY